MTTIKSSRSVTAVKLSLVNTTTASGGAFQSGLLRSVMYSTIPVELEQECIVTTDSILMKGLCAWGKLRTYFLRVFPSVLESVAPCT